MSDHERGAYAPPTDAPLTFDARQPVRGARPIPATLIISILVLGGLAAAIFLFYRQGVRQAGQPPQAVGTPVAGMKAAPPPEAQPADPAAGLQIYKTEGGTAQPAAPAQPTFTPGPEQPQKRAETNAAPAVVVAPPAQLPPAQPQPALRPALPAAPPAAAPVQVAKASPPPAPAPKSAAPAPKAEAAPPPAPKEVAKAAPPPAPVAKAAAPAAKPAPPPAKAAAAPASAPASSAVTGSFVQIGAVSSQALADKAWSDAAAVAPGQSAGKGKHVEQVQTDGGKTLYRVQMTGFASKADAAAYCDKLKAAGKQCFAR